MKAWVRWMLAGALASCAALADARCTHPVVVPLAPIGLSVTFDGERPTGIYPQLLRELSTRAGCKFQMQRVPRARLQKMFETGQADMLLPASASPARDDDGEFVPLIQVRAALVTLGRDNAAPHSLAELLGRPDYKLAVVRGFSFGAAYDDAVAMLRAQKRLVEEADAAGVARSLRLGAAQATVMTASIFIGTLVNDPELAPLLKQLHLGPLDELAWSESGLYLSRRSLSEADRRTLRHAFAHVARTGRVWQLFLDSHPPGSLVGNVRPLP